MKILYPYCCTSFPVYAANSLIQMPHFADFFAQFSFYLSDVLSKTTNSWECAIHAILWPNSAMLPYHKPKKYTKLTWVFVGLSLWLSMRLLKITLTKLVCGALSIHHKITSHKMIYIYSQKVCGCCNIRLNRLNKAHFPARVESLVALMRIF